MAEDDARRVQSLRGTRQQLLARRINERIFALREGAATSEYVCECVLKSCDATIALSADEYREIRTSPTRFVIACGGWLPAVERLVYETEGHVVVEKLAATEVLLASRSGHDHERRDGLDG